ncbi:MAG: SpoIIE family protein phosphatase [Bacteroidota bacterium]
MVNTGFRKINIGFMIIVLVALAHAVISFLIISGNNRSVNRMVNEINPYVESLEQFNLMVTESKMYATNWVYLRFREEDKKNLQKLHVQRYPQLKKNLFEQLRRAGKVSEEDSLKLVVSQFERLSTIEQMIMLKLATFDDYENTKRFFEAEELIESEVLPRTDSIQAGLERIITGNRMEAEKLRSQVVSASNRLMSTVFGFSLGLFGAVVLASLFISRAIRRPVLRMKDIILKLGRGELPEGGLAASHDVIGEMALSVNTLKANFEKTSQFANEIRKGNFSADFELLSENDQLGYALLNMRNSLKAYSHEMESQVAERTREVIEKSEKLEVAYGEIRDSIQYAKRIQEAILPSQQLIRKAFPESFVFYKSKDIVCGDFYWFAEKNQEVMMAAIDCTGHGVPGAMMTVIGNSLLNQIVHVSDVNSPGKILDHLDKRLLETLQQHGDAHTNDGMDVALFKYNPEKRQLSFAGAKRSLYLFRDGELKEIQGSKLPIGSFQYEQKKTFTEHTALIRPGDTVYVFSDGYQDQFGGPFGKKYMVKQFRERLRQIHHLPMEEQREVLETEIMAWKGAYDQTDDMLVIGIRFTR